MAGSSWTVSSQLVVRCMMTMQESLMISGQTPTVNRYVSSRLKKRGVIALRARQIVHETKVSKALAMIRNGRGRFIRRTRRISHLLRFMAMGSATSVLNSLDSIITSAIAKFRWSMCRDLPIAATRMSYRRIQWKSRTKTEILVTQKIPSKSTTKI